MAPSATDRGGEAWWAEPATGTHSAVSQTGGEKKACFDCPVPSLTFGAEEEDAPGCEVLERALSS